MKKIKFQHDLIKKVLTAEKIAAYLNDQNRTNKYVHKTYGKMG